MILGCWEVERVIEALRGGEEYSGAKGRNSRSRWVEGPGLKNVNPCFASILSASIPDSCYLNTEIYPSLQDSLNEDSSQLIIFLPALILSISLPHFHVIPVTISEKIFTPRPVYWLCLHSEHRGRFTGEWVHSPGRVSQDPCSTLTVQEIGYTCIYFLDNLNRMFLICQTLFDLCRRNYFILSVTLWALILLLSSFYRETEAQRSKVTLLVNFKTRILSNAGSSCFLLKNLWYYFSSEIVNYKHHISLSRWGVWLENTTNGIKA